ncbi:hypothetical protein AOXY_G12936 [Acipenser oxyrinchus oxyrinchus]|uniref:SET domain-containing protein n=1 Tax=Acipenser oxyrinchus oxyrinchus TaxID=40147 RepID=A0AAD8DBL3_ACIOX|nr:hypothetical protein AOXY_G12936 [Acipenser oxyrinchus oxyrinchus]
MHELHEDYKHYLECLTDLQKNLNKQVSQEITGKRFMQMVAKTRSPAECLVILLVAKKDFLEIIDKAAIETALDEQEYLTVLYYVEAVLMLRHLQRPGVVKNMTWFDIYYQFVRSTFLKKPDLKTISKSDKDTFFVYTSGNAIYNPSNDLHRFHDKYKLPSITSQFARRIFETSIKTGFTDAEKGLVADYLAHTTATAEKHYHVIDHFPCRQPSVSQIERYINRQEWKKNAIKAANVERAWLPASSTTSNPTLKLDNILKLIKTQVWKGQHIQQNSDKGKLVTTTRKFAKGELACDYHGIPRSHKEGLQLLQDSAKDEMGYLFFYTNTTGQKCCMDARTVPCPCHPELDTFGQRINHSKKKPNLKPVLKNWKIDNTVQDVIIFIATRDLAVGEELLFAYGVARTSFGGEAADAECLDT